jgi:hypothetical protein
LVFKNQTAVNTSSVVLYVFTAELDLLVL